MVVGGNNQHREQGKLPTRLGRGILPSNMANPLFMD
jgi:hypothetical protein